MRKNMLVLFVIIITALGLITSTANAQFVKGGNYIGAHIGLSGVGSAITLGLDYERAITDPGEVGPGIIGIGGVFDYFTYGSNEFGYSDVGTWTYIDFGVSGMYHFVLDNKKLDPFVGLILGYEVASWSWKGDYSYLNKYYSPSAGGFTLGGSVGIRYFINDNLALQARAGFGFYLVAVGVDFKF